MMPWEVRELRPRWKVKVTKQTEADTEVEQAKENEDKDEQLAFEIGTKTGTEICWY